MQTTKKRQILHAQFGQTKMNLEKLNHGFFRQQGQLDNLEIVLRDSWRFERNSRFFGAHFCFPHEKNGISIK